VAAKEAATTASTKEATLATIAKEAIAAAKKAPPDTGPDGSDDSGPDTKHADNKKAPDAMPDPKAGLGKPRHQQVAPTLLPSGFMVAGAHGVPGVPCTSEVFHFLFVCTCLIDAPSL
jgi:hypothetical protein